MPSHYFHLIPHSSSKYTFFICISNIIILLYIFFQFIYLGFLSVLTLFLLYFFLVRMFFSISFICSFRDLSVDHSNFVGLKFLCTFLSIGEDDIEAEHRIFSTPVIPSLSSPWTERQLSPFRQKLQDPHNSDGLCTSLFCDLQPVVSC